MVSRMKNSITVHMSPFKIIWYVSMTVDNQEDADVQHTTLLMLILRDTSLQYDKNCTI
jgi:hypothetical protein